MSLWLYGFLVSVCVCAHLTAYSQVSVAEKSVATKPVLADAPAYTIELDYEAPSARPHYPHGDLKRTTRCFQEDGSGFVWQYKGEYFFLTADHVTAGLSAGYIAIKDNLRNDFLVNFLGAETLFDVCVYQCQRTKLPSKALSFISPEEWNTYRLGVDSVEAWGYEGQSTHCERFNCKVIQEKVSIPDGGGKSFLRMFLKTDKKFPEGYSGGPLMWKGKVIGMILGNYKGNGYVLPAAALQKATKDIISGGRIARVLVGGVWKEEPKRGVVLVDVLKTDITNPAINSLKKFQGQRLVSIGGTRIRNLEDLRTFMETSPIQHDAEAKLRFTFEDKAEVFLTLRCLQLSDYESIAQYYNTNGYFGKAGTLRQTEDRKSLKGVFGGRTEYITSIGTSSLSCGFICNKYHELGIILRMLAPASQIEVFCIGKNDLIIDTPPILIY